MLECRLKAKGIHAARTVADIEHLDFFFQILLPWG